MQSKLIWTSSQPLCNVDSSVASMSSSAMHAPLRRHIRPRSMLAEAADRPACRSRQTSKLLHQQRCSAAQFRLPHSDMRQHRSGDNQRHVALCALCAAADGVQQPASAGSSASPSSNGNGGAARQRKHVLVLGGTGRVGSSGAASLIQAMSHVSQPSCTRKLSGHARLQTTAQQHSALIASHTMIQCTLTADCRSCSCVCAQQGVDVDISLSGRRPEAFDKVLQARPELKTARFRQCDIDDAASLAAALEVVRTPTH